MPKLSLAKSRQTGVAGVILVQNGANILTLTVIPTTSALYKRVRLWLPHRLLKHHLLSPTNPVQNYNHPDGHIQST